MKRIYTREFKLELCRLVTTKASSANALCREHGLSGGTLDRWLKHYALKGEDSFEGQWRQPDPAPVEAKLRARVAELEGALGRAHLELEFMEEALGKLGGHHGNGPR
jgi:transposase-like protein